MKTIILFLLFAVPVLAQNGFRTEKGKIIWEHTYDENANIETLIKGQEKLSLLLVEGNVYDGIADAIKSTVDANSVRLASDANFSFTITKIDGGYKVRVYNYVFLEKYGPMQMRTVPNAIEKYYLEYGKIRNSDKTKTDLGYLDGFLTGAFLPQVVQAGAEVAVSK
jgi:hypothetical protein